MFFYLHDLQVRFEPSKIVLIIGVEVGEEEKIVADEKVLTRTGDVTQEATE